MVGFRTAFLAEHKCIAANSETSSIFQPEVHISPKNLNTPLTLYMILNRYKYDR